MDWLTGERGPILCLATPTLSPVGSLGGSFSEFRQFGVMQLVSIRHTHTPYTVLKAWGSWEWRKKYGCVNSQMELSKFKFLPSVLLFCLSYY